MAACRVHLNYRTRAIITRSRFETALDYKPRIFKVRKVSFLHLFYGKIYFEVCEPFRQS